MAEIEQALALERHFNQTTSYLDMFKTKGNRHRLLISITMGVFAQWNGVGIVSQNDPLVPPTLLIIRQVSYYLAAVLETVGVTSVTKQTLISGFLQLFNLIVAVSAATQVDRFGRRPLLLASTVGMLSCYIIITGLSGSFATTGKSATGLAVIPMLFLYYGFYDIAFTPLLISYPTEIWQYHLRSRGVAVTQFSTFAALFFNLFVNPIALSAIAWKYYIVYVAILVLICITCYYFYPETRGRSLEEIAIVFDGEDAAVPRQGVVLSAVEDHMAKMGHSMVEQVEYVDDSKV